MSKVKLLFVAPNGHDTWSGERPAPTGDGDGPFASVARARDAARALKSRGGWRRPVRILIRGGRYELPETLRFGPEDSGAAETPITYAAFPGETPVLSGGRRITGWTVGEHHGQPCWSVRLPDVAAGKWYFTQLFVNDARRPRTRKPRAGFLRFAGLPEPPPERFQGVRWAQYAPGDINPRWRNLTDVKIVALQHWFESHLHIASVEEPTCTVRFQAPSISDLRDEKGWPARYYVENIFEELCEPGQWYLDRQDGMLYYLPLPGETPEHTVVVAPRLKTLLWVDGARADGPVRHLRFENLTLVHAEWTLPRSNPGAVQAACNIPGAIVFGGAEDCMLLGCRIAHVSQYAVEVRIGCLRTRILGCRLHDLGAGGVKINSEAPLEGLATNGSAPSITGSGAFRDMAEELDGYKPLPWLGELIPGRDVAPGMHTEVADCTIHDAGLIHHSAVGIWIGNSGYNHVHHNEIFNLTYTAISSGWTWSYCPSFTVANRIEYNHLHHIGQELLSDMGGIYLLGLHPGSTVKGNVIHDVSAYGYGGWGIYADQAASYLRIEDNLVYRTKHGGFHQHFARDNIVRNNILALSSSAEIVRSRSEAVRSFVMEHNLVYETRGQPVGGDWRNPNVRVDRNLYWRAHGPPRFVDRTFDQWQAAGFDRHGGVADPLFEAPELGRFELRADSPAPALGFRPFDPSQAGPRPLRSRPASADDVPARGFRPRPLPQCRFELGPPTQPRADRDLERIRVEPMCIPVKPGVPTEITLSVTNYGQAPARGRVALGLFPRGAGTLRGARSLRYVLKPGAQAAITFHAVLRRGHRHLLIEARPSDPAVHPSAFLLTAEQRPSWRMTRLPGPVTLDQVPAALADVAPRRLTAGGELLAELRLALAGDQVALLADVQDVRLEAGHPPWEGSCVELFGSQPAVKEVGQVLLVPETDREPGRAWQLRAGLHVAPTVALLTTRRPGGYRLAALVPADLLRIDPAADCLLLEMKVTAVASGGDGEWVRSQAFEAVAPHASNIGYAEVKVKSAQAGGLQ